jgi:DNA topoisomerase VI subunit B
MQESIELKSPETKRVAAATAATLPPKSAPDWKPQPCGLSRQELRRIVRKMLG